MHAAKVLGRQAFKGAPNLGDFQAFINAANLGAPGLMAHALGRRPQRSVA